ESKSTGEVQGAVRGAVVQDSLDAALAGLTGATSEGQGEGFSGPKVCKIVGISYRQLDYWARTDLVRPSLADAHGSGTQRRYSYRDLVRLKVIKNLLDAGVKLQTARKAIDYIPGDPPAPSPSPSIP